MNMHGAWHVRPGHDFVSFCYFSYVFSKNNWKDLKDMMNKNIFGHLEKFHQKKSWVRYSLHAFPEYYTEHKKPGSKLCLLPQEKLLLVPKCIEILILRLN